MVLPSVIEKSVMMWAKEEINKLPNIENAVWRWWWEHPASSIGSLQRRSGKLNVLSEGNDKYVGICEPYGEEQQWVNEEKLEMMTVDINGQE